MKRINAYSGGMMFEALNKHDLAEMISASEVARLLDQDRLLNEDMGGLFPPQLDLSLVQRVLDMACGPGGWAIEVARTHSTMEVIGVDMRQPMITHAQFRATVLEQENVHFLLMDATKPFIIPHMSFDLVHVRLLNSYFTTEQRSIMLANMLHACRAGGYLYFTEALALETNSPALEYLCELAYVAQQYDGGLLTVDAEGKHTLALLMQEGCHVLGMQDYHLDWSWGTPTHATMYQNVLLCIHLLRPLMVQKMQVVSAEEYDRLYHCMQLETYCTNFVGTWHYRSTWGQKRIPAHS